MASALQPDYLVGKDFVERVAVVAQGHAGVGRDLCNVHGGVQVDHIFALGVDLSRQRRRPEQKETFARRRAARGNGRH